MIILEIIQLRSAARLIDTLCEQIESSIQDEVEESPVVTIYRGQGLETDLAIHIHRNPASSGEGPSELGLRLASELEAFGLVDHTLWRELRGSSGT